MYLSFAQLLRYILHFLELVFAVFIIAIPMGQMYVDGSEDNQCILWWNGATAESNGACHYLIVAGCVGIVGALVGLCVTFSAVGDGREHGNPFVVCWSVLAWLIFLIMLAGAIDWNAGFANFLPNNGDIVLANNGRNKGLIVWGIICAWVSTVLWFTDSFGSCVAFCIGRRQRGTYFRQPVGRSSWFGGGKLSGGYGGGGGAQPVIVTANPAVPTQIFGYVGPGFTGQNPGLTSR